MIKKILLGLGGLLIGAILVFRHVGDDPTYHPSGLNDTFPEVKTFDEYMEKSQTMIRQARLKMGTNNPDPDIEEEIIKARAPFELAPKNLAPDQRGKKAKYRNGILISHGLKRTPREMQSIADYFAKLGFLVRVTLLPGHGTVIGDLGRVKYEEWVKMHQFALESFQGEVDNLYLMGFSTGGLVTCMQALDPKKMEDHNVRGILLFAPALALPSKVAQMMPTLYPLLNQFPALRFLEKRVEDDPYAYASFSINSVAQISLLTEKFQKTIQKKGFKLPLFVVNSSHDATVDVAAMAQYLDLATHPHNEFLIFAANPVPLPKVHGHIKQINASQWAWGGRIIGFSHVALHISPEDPHYGRFTDYHFCNHYERGSDQHKACLTGNAYLTSERRTCARYGDGTEKRQACETSRAYIGEILPENIQKYTPLQRMMYNNKFKDMTRSLDRFLYKTGALDANRYQLRAFKRIQEMYAAKQDFDTLLKEKYNNKDLTSALEDASVDLDLGLLDSLILKDTSIQDFSGVAQLSSLRRFALEDNAATADLSSLKAAKKLKGFILRHTPCRDISFLNTLSSLETIHLFDTTYITKAQVDTLHQHFPKADIIHFNPHFIAPEDLEALGGNVGTYVADYHRRNPAAAEAITTLFIKDTSLTSLEGLASLKSFEDLRLNRTPLPDPSVFEALKGIPLKEVKFFDLDPRDGPRFKEIATILERDHPHVTITVRFDVLIKDRLLKNGGDLQKALAGLDDFNLPQYLRILDLDKTGVSDLGPLENFVNLEGIHLSETAIRDLSPLKNLEQIKTLTANKTSIASLEALENFKNMDTLEIEDTQVSDLGPLKNCQNLQFIFMKNAPVTSLEVVAHLPKIESIWGENTKVDSLKGLEHAYKLEALTLDGTSVKDVTPLKDLNLGLISLSETQVADMTPLIDSNNTGIYFEDTPFWDAVWTLDEQEEKAADN